MSDKYSFMTMSKTAQLTPGETRAVANHLEHYAAFMKDRKQFAVDGIPLSVYVMSALIDEGKIPGIEFGGGNRTLELYSSDLASALDKIDALLPKQAHPLAEVE